jgi:hypothetical protein
MKYANRRMISRERQADKRSQQPDGQDEYELSPDADLDVMTPASVLALQSTIGNQAVQRLMAEGRIGSPPAIQRDEASASSLTKSALKNHRLLPDSSLHLDPEIEARIRLMQAQLQWGTIKDSLRSINLGLPNNLPPSSPNQKPGYLTPPPAVNPDAPDPRGEGPIIPRAGEAGDVVDAVLASPSIEKATDELRERAARSWSLLSPNEKGSVISVSVLIGSGLLTGLLKNDQTRQMLLDTVQGISYPVPRVPGLSFNLKLIGPEQSITFNLDLMEILYPDKK